MSEDYGIITHGDLDVADPLLADPGMVRPPGRGPSDRPAPASGDCGPRVARNEIHEILKY